MDLKVSTETVRVQAVRNLREAIISGMFQPGDRLIETEMCVRLGISRPSLREALRSLEAEKLVVIVPNKGPHIPILSLEEANQIYDVRALLEGEAAALFSKTATVVAIDIMRKALAAFDGAINKKNRPDIVGMRERYHPRDAEYAHGPYHLFKIQIDVTAWAGAEK
jgi:DNA-binding GntR family transcriptional regulator